ncbi:MAG: prepilin-type N-terminal cleavage/methylation domain-containing protein [Phycisphaerae bacterium]
MTTTDTKIRRIRPGGATRAHRGFSLMEMVVVIGLVALMASLALPSIIALYNAGADAQAYNLIAAQLTAARALAIEKATYAGVHVQLADAKDGARLLRPDMENVCYSAIVLYDSRMRRFDIYGQLRRVPGSMAFGKLTERTVNSGDGTYRSDAADKEVFTTFTVVFSPRGSAVKSVHGSPVWFNGEHPIFSDAGVDTNTLRVTGSQRLWEWANVDPNGSAGQDDCWAVTALTLFDIGDYLGGANPSARVKYLNESAQFLPLNVHTGQLFMRE